MPLPNFSNDELYLINYVKSSNASSSSYMFGYVVGGLVVAGFAAYYGSIPMLLSAFVVVCGFRLYEERYQLKWIPLWRSIIDKFEAACVCQSKNRADDGGGDQ